MNTETYNLQVRAEGMLAELAHLSIYNGTFTRISRGYGSLSARVPKGIYTVRVESNEEVANQAVVVNKDVSVSINVPAGASSIPIKGYASTQEYYVRPCETWSLQSTHSGTDGSGGIFIFFRYPDKASRELSNGESLGENFVLVNSDHTPICKLEGSSIQEDLEHGCLAFSARLAPGMYYLQYLDTPSREIPLFIYQDWQTQAYMTFVDGPLFQTLCISMSRMGQGFNSHDPNLALIDGVTQKFRNGIFYVPENVLRTLASDKWENPMLGIVAAFICLKAADTANDPLLSAIIRNIETRIFYGSPESPDVKVLKVLAALRFNETIDEVSVELPCMFRPALKELIQVSAEYPEVISHDSFLEKILVLFYGDSVWTSYLPIHRTRDRGVGFVKSERTSKRKTSPKRVTQEPVADKLSLIVKDLVKSGRDMRSMNLREVAQALNVTTKTASEAIARALEDADISSEIKQELKDIGKKFLDKASSKFKLFKKKE